MINFTLNMQYPDIHTTDYPLSVGKLVCRKKNNRNKYDFESSWPYEFGVLVEENSQRWIIHDRSLKPLGYCHKHSFGKNGHWGFVTQQVIDEMNHFFINHFIAIFNSYRVQVTVQADS